MSSVTVALDNIKVSVEDGDIDTILAYDIMMNDILERNRSAVAQAWADLAIFGSCELPVLQ